MADNKAYLSTGGGTRTYTYMNIYIHQYLMGEISIVGQGTQWWL